MEYMQSEARNIAAEALRDDVRYDGSPFLSHVDSVALIVQDEIGLPPECVAAVYLHEATRVHRDIDLNAFPQDVRAMVDGLNKISAIKPKDTRLEAENYKKLIVQYSSDPRVIVIKIADRLEVMRSLDMFPKSSRDQKVLETMMLYMPLAHQLGLYNINKELGDICFRYDAPDQYRQITAKLKAGEKERERLMQEFIEPLKKKLSEAGIRYKLKVRTKSAYSIHRKMQVQNVPFEGVFDVFAIRFIIDCEPDSKLEKDLCWKVYSYVTEEYEPDTSRLRDWLTTPRPNGYESLHITVKNKEGAYLEVQIRTKRMDDEAENGAASHWAYKGIQHEQTLDRWLSSVRYTLEHPVEAKPEDMPQTPDKEIFVFTPTGELKMLPAGASVLDFAFSIHSNLGCRCTGGRINGKTVQIKEKLQTGDTVEIITSRNQRPGRDWVNWVVTSKARNKIRQELDVEERKAAAEGRETLTRRLKNWKLELPDEHLVEYMKAHKFSSLINFMAAIGREEVDVNDIKAFILSRDAENAAHLEELRQAEASRQLTDIGKNYTAGSDDILVINAKGVKGLEYKMARCCSPVFGDDVFGFVTRTQGITIHRINCPNAARLHERYPYRCQKVIWQDTPTSGSFQVALKVESAFDHSVITQVMDVIGQFKASLRAFNVSEKEKNHEKEYEISLRILIPSNLELDKIISRLSAIPKVHSVHR